MQFDVYENLPIFVFDALEATAWLLASKVAPIGVLYRNLYNTAEM